MDPGRHSLTALELLLVGVACRLAKWTGARNEERGNCEEECDGGGEE